MFQAYEGLNQGRKVDSKKNPSEASYFGGFAIK